MLNFFKRNHLPARLPVGADPLRIRNLLDDPRLQAVMGSTASAVSAVSAESDTTSPTFTGLADGEFVLGTAA